MIKLLNIYVYIAPLITIILCILGIILNNDFVASLGCIPMLTGILAAVYVDTH